MKRMIIYSRKKSNMVKKGLHVVLSAAFILLCGCSKNIRHSNPDNFPAGEINQHYSKADTIKNLLKEYTSKGLPGAVVTIYSANEQWWEGAAGFSKIESGTPMETSHLQYLQSVSKTYMSVAILKLWEQGKINLDAAITTYLPQRFINCVTGAGKITVRHLLNHVSGIADYTEIPAYTAYLIQHPDHRFTSEELMNYIKGQGSEFIPGTKFRYSNTNFELLAFIADSITGDHADYIYKKIILPLQLTHTFYRYDHNYLTYPQLVNCYLDRFSNSSIENITEMQRINVLSMAGDDGFVATPRDAVRFLKALFEGQLLSPAAMLQMTTWIKDANGENIQGMGLYHVKYSGVIGYGHGGSGIGAGCGLYYFPSKGIYVFMGTNLGTIVEGPLVDKIGELKIKLMDVLLK